MNILYASSKKNWGGINSWMQKTAKGLISKGHRVWLIGAKRSAFATQLANEPFFIPIKYGTDYNPITIFKIWRFIKKHKIDLVVTNTDKDLSIAGVAAKLAGVPNIRRVGGSGDFASQKSKIKFRHKNFVTATIAPCDALWRESKAHSGWLEEYPFHTIYNGRNPIVVDLETKNKIKKDLNIENFKTVFGVTCRLEKGKGLELLISGLAPFLQNCQEMVLVIAGKGKMEELLREKARALGIEKQVVFAGFVINPIELASVYDIGFLLSELEGFPNTIVEYYAAGIPVVATKVGGVDEIVIDGKNGFLIAVDDKDALIGRVTQLVENPSLFEKMKEEAKKTIDNGFSEDQMIEEVERFYLQVLSRKHQ